MYALPNDRDVQSVTAADFPDLEDNRSSRLAFHLVAAFLGLETFSRKRVYFEDFVTAAQAVLLCRRPVVRLVDYNVPVLFLVYDCTDAAVCVGEHHLQVLVFLFRNIYGIWVKLIEHCVYSSPHYSVKWKRVHI